MGRPPCCDKMVVKKGPWTPEEDIMLVSYVQRHGPGNWRQVPTNTATHLRLRCTRSRRIDAIHGRVEIIKGGNQVKAAFIDRMSGWDSYSRLCRCSKSCRLRWTNYLRPGIRRGDFTHDEETIIIQLQALLGNKWSAIASYLPERTDNDIKNHWNTHLKNKLRKLYDHDHDHPSSSTTTTSSSSSSSHHISRGQWEKRLQTDVHMAKQALNDALSLDKPFIFLDNFIPPPDQTTTYASSTNNIAKLLKGFMKNAPISLKPSSDYSSTNGIDSSQGFESLLIGFDQSFGSTNGSDLSLSNMSPKESKPELIGAQLPFTMFENWLLDEAGGDDVINQRKTDLTRFAFDQKPDCFHN